MRTIILTRGMEALVDDDDYDCLRRYSWYLEPGRQTDYAACKIDRRKESMHGFIAYVNNLLIVGEIDHIDRNGLNNQKTNFRSASSSQNKVNTGIRSTNTSGYKGVTWNRERQKWQVQACEVNLGRYTDIVEAALVYDGFMYKRFGDRAVLNFPIKG